jgi:hypothetical protein
LILITLPGCCKPIDHSVIIGDRDSLPVEEIWVIWVRVSRIKPVQDKAGAEIPTLPGSTKIHIPRWNPAWRYYEVKGEKHPKAWRIRTGGSGHHSGCPDPHRPEQKAARPPPGICPLGNTGNAREERSTCLHMERLEEILQAKTMAA